MENEDQLCLLPRRKNFIYLFIKSNIQNDKKYNNKKS